MRIFRGMLVLAAAASLLFGCAKERTVEEFELEKQRDKLARFQAAQGLYSGLLINSKGQSIGAIEINIVARLESPSGSGGGEAGKGGEGYKAILVSELHFKDSTTRAELRTAKGYFDPDNGIYQADFEIPSVKRIVSVTGNINSGTIRGTMQGVGFSSQVASFDIRVGGGKLDDLSKATKPAPGSELENIPVEFKGNVDWDPADKAKPEPIEMMALFLVRTAEEHFVNLFLPESSKSIQVQLTYGDGVGHVTFSAATWDMEPGRLYGESQWSSPSTGTVTRRLLCTGFFLLSTRGQVICDFWTDRTKIAKMILRLSSSQ